jgi:hypothetical protein
LSRRRSLHPQKAPSSWRSRYVAAENIEYCIEKVTP